MHVGPGKADTELQGIVPRVLQQVSAAQQHRGYCRPGPCPYDSELSQMFGSLTADPSLAHWSVRVSYVEVYNEAFHDLLGTGASRPELKLEEFK